MSENKSLVSRSLVSRSLVYLGILFILIPLLVLVIWSFTGRWPWPELLPQTFSTKAIDDLFGGQLSALKVLASSIGLSAVVALLAIAVSIPASRAMELAEFRGKELLKFTVFLPVIVPATAFAMGVHTLFIQVGLNDTLTSVVLMHIILCLPYTVQIMSQIVAATGDRLEAQARVLGASPLKTFTDVTLPTLMPGIISAACMAFIVSFSQYFVTLLLGGGRVVTYAMFMFPYIQSGDRTMAAAYSVLFILASLVVFVVFDRLVKKYYALDDVVFFG